MRTAPRASLLWIVLVGGCSPQADPNVVLVTLDTVRADHLGCYGYDRPTSPHIDALARSADLYPDALATAPWTVPTHASIFTGRFPFQHGAHSFRSRRADRHNVFALASEHTTLAEALQGVGYRTAAFVSNEAFLKRGFGLDQGFELYQVGPLRARRINRDVFRWLRRGEEPFFLFVNYMDAHRPYNIEPVTTDLPPPVPTDPSELLDRLKHAVMGGEAADLDSLRRQVVDQYDMGVANTDAAVGALVAELRELDLYDGTMIVLTSDHGEYFGEHGLVEHSKDVYQEGLRVPLIVKHPDQKRARVLPERASSVDLPRLIASRLSRDSRERLQRLFPYEPGSHPVLSENYYSRAFDLTNPIWGHRFDRVRAALYAGSHKLIQSSDGQDELYDLRNDPRETRNLVRERPELAASLRAEVETFKEAFPAPVQPDPVGRFSEEEIERLRALGYL